MHIYAVCTIQFIACNEHSMNVWLIDILTQSLPVYSIQLYTSFVFDFRSLLHFNFRKIWFYTFEIGRRVSGKQTDRQTQIHYTDRYQNVMRNMRPIHISMFDSFQQHSVQISMYIYYKCVLHFVRNPKRFHLQDLPTEVYSFNFQLNSKRIPKAMHTKKI